MKKVVLTFLYRVLQLVVAIEECDLGVEMNSSIKRLLQWLVIVEKL